MSLLTIDPQMRLNRNSFSRHGSSSSTTQNPSLGFKTISNYFFTPDKIPQTFEEPRQYRTSQKPFFSKNRKFLNSKLRVLKGTQIHVIVPTGFKNLLRAKSTVIKQKKLQEFYINKEGRQTEAQSMNQRESDSENVKSRLFKPNFPHKKAKGRKLNSISLQKSHNSQEGNQDVDKLASKVITIQSMTEDLTEMALKEKEFYQNYVIKKQSPGAKTHWRTGQKKPRPVLDKENLQFMISPWGGGENEDVYF